MKTRSRPPLDLKDPEPGTAQVEPATADTGSLPDTVPEPETAPAPSASSLPMHSVTVRPDGGAKAAYPLAIAAALLWIGGVASYAAYEVGGGGWNLNPSRSPCCPSSPLRPPAWCWSWPI